MEDVAGRESRGEAVNIREADRMAADAREVPVPDVPLFDGWGDPTLADRVDDLLAESFGK